MSYRSRQDHSTSKSKSQPSMRTESFLVQFKLTKPSERHEASSIGSKNDVDINLKLMGRESTGCQLSISWWLDPDVFYVLWLDCVCVVVLWLKSGVGWGVLRAFLRANYYKREREAKKRKGGMLNVCFLKIPSCGLTQAREIQYEIFYFWCLLVQLAYLSDGVLSFTECFVCAL